MIQPGAVLTSDTQVDNYNGFSSGNPALAYGAISGGIQGNIGNSTFSFGSARNVVVALDLYRVTKTSGTNATDANSTLWHISNNKTTPYSDNTYPGSNSARADFLGTITLTSDGAVSFIAQGNVPSAPTVTTPPTASSITFGQTLENATLTGGNSSVAGSYAFASSSTVPSTGTATYSVIFTPTDIGNYTTTTANVSVTVSKATTSIISAPTASSITFGQSLSSSILSSGNASVNGTFDFTSPGTGPSAGTSLHSVTFTPTDSGNYTTT
ncbi:MAG: hypothetical protein NTZ94_06220, partial [Verrucomicrobia bacterium]|nr:hypothetical protein [Verrucomicrobiota bacterium]